MSVRGKRGTIRSTPCGRTEIAPLFAGDKHGVPEATTVLEAQSRGPGDANDPSHMPTLQRRKHAQRALNAQKGPVCFEEVTQEQTARHRSKPTALRSTWSEVQGVLNWRQKKTRVNLITRVLKKIPAASYSPTESPQQYHRLQGA